MPVAPPVRRAAARLQRATRLALCAVATVAFTAAVAAPASASTAGSTPTSRATSAGGIGLRLVDVPVAAGDDPRARIYVVDHLPPGTVIHRRIEVSNTTASAAHIALYPAAGNIRKGSFLGAAGHTVNDVSSWTSVSPGAADVPAGGRELATVTITVPRDAAPGERYGVVWAEARSAPVSDGGVVQVSRVGIRLYISVGPGGPPAADFAIESLTAERSSDGRPMVLATVHNTGGRALDISGTLQLLAGPGGLRAGPFPVTLGLTLAIGDTEPVTIVLDPKLPAGPWDARIALRSGLVERSARGTISFPVSGASPSVPVSSSRRRSFYPAVAGTVVMLLGSTSILRVSRGRRRRRTNARAPFATR
jgi:hypothetical protein